MKHGGEIAGGMKNGQNLRGMKSQSKLKRAEKCPTSYGEYPPEQMSSL